MPTGRSVGFGVAVFCGSNPGNQPAFKHAAQSLGQAIGESGRNLVYGGGTKGIMGVVSETALRAGADVTGVIPYAMVKDDAKIGQRDEASVNIELGGGQLEHRNSVVLEKHENQKIETIVVSTMHERKVEMAKRVSGFIGLPGGYGTFEELLEVTTWSQLKIHNKPVVLVNVLGFYNPLRDLVQSGIRSGFIQPQNEGLMVFIDGPSDMSLHETYDWGQDALNALDSWKAPEWEGYGYDWTKRIDRKNEPMTPLEAS